MFLSHVLSEAGRLHRRVVALARLARSLARPTPLPLTIVLLCAAAALSAWLSHASPHGDSDVETPVTVATEATDLAPVPPSAPADSDDDPSWLGAASAAFGATAGAALIFSFTRFRSRSTDPEPNNDLRDADTPERRRSWLTLASLTPDKQAARDLAKLASRALALEAALQCAKHNDAEKRRLIQQTNAALEYERHAISTWSACTAPSPTCCASTSISCRRRSSTSKPNLVFRICEVIRPCRPIGSSRKHSST